MKLGLVGLGVLMLLGLAAWRVWRRPPPAEARLARMTATELHPDDTGDSGEPPAAPAAGAKKATRTALSPEKRRELVALAVAGNRVRAAQAAAAVAAEANGQAEAPEPELTPEEHLARAKEIFNQAQDLFVAKQYTEAADAFLEAYDEKAAPTFIYNAAVSYMKVGMCDDAVALFARYQAEDPHHDDHAEREEHHPARTLATCQALAAELAAQAAAAPAQ